MLNSLPDINILTELLSNIIIVTRHHHHHCVNETDQQKAFVGVDDPYEDIHPVAFAHLVLRDDDKVCVPILRLQ